MRTSPCGGDVRPRANENGPMAWRRGELWLDADLPWLRAAAGGPSFAVAGPAPLPSFGPPPWLLASRQRRAAWQQRRRAKRAKATAIALSPAVVLALAALRSGGDPRHTIAADDPPSLTF